VLVVFGGYHPHYSSRTVDKRARRSPLLTIPQTVNAQLNATPKYKKKDKIFLLIRLKI
jgi:hypothetical protein